MGATKTGGLATDRAEIYYPESDGKPMAETDLHRNEMFDLIAMLEARYADAPDVYVSGNLLLYYVEGDPRRAVAPDVFVVFGVPKGLRRVYKLWAEAVPPAVVFEVTSRKTRAEDLRTKRALYERLGVAEYYLYDPEAEYLRPPLQALHLVDGAFVPVAADAAGTVRSPRLGLELRLVNGWLQLFDADTGQRLPRVAERRDALARAEHAMVVERRQAVAERRRAAAARQRAEQAESELARLRTELERLRAEG
jgi:Uma2 family endonuclease